MHIEHVASQTELFHQYPGETNPQDVFVYLDCAARKLSIGYRQGIGNGCIPRVYYGHIQAFATLTLKKAAANALLDSLEELAERVCEGYSEHWDGSNNVARFDDDASKAIEEMERRCGDVEESEALSIWDASDWYANTGSYRQQRVTLGITPNTTDEELEALAKREEEIAQDETDGVRGILDHLTMLRDDAL